MVPNVILSILFWQVPVEDPLTISALLIDRLLQLTVVVFPFSLLAVLIAPLRIARLGAVIGSICSASLGGSAALSAWEQEPVKRFPTILAVVCLVIGVVLLLVLTYGVLLTARWQQISVVGVLLVILPAIQLWHATSFAPARLTTSMSVTNLVVKVQSTEKERRGTTQFAVQNGSETGALILLSHEIMCFRESDADLDTNKLSEDKDCESWRPITAMSPLNGKTSYIIHEAFSKSKDKQFVYLYVKVYYARSDRLRIGDEVVVDAAQKANCSRGHIATYRLSDDAKFKGLVLKERYITYEGDTASDPAAYSITVKGEPLCDPSRYDLPTDLGVSWVESRQQDWLPVK
jgi:hypothetical protein